MRDSDVRVSRQQASRFLLVQVYGGTGDGETVQLFGQHGLHLAAVDGPRAFQLGPTEWLLLDYSDGDARRELLANAGRALAKVTDVSDAFATLCIEGPRARELLATDTAAPELLNVTMPQRYARTRIGQVDMILQCVRENAFELHVDRSLVDYIQSWITAQHEAQLLSPAH
jgi:heterotetrameric sarcosine oxidase gamma subunit